MTERPFDQSFRARAVRRALLIAWVVAIVLAPSAAWAYAPMCDESAQTVEAPLPIYPSKDGSISAVADCDSQSSRFDAAPDRAPERPLLDAQSIDRGLAIVAAIPACAKSARLELSSHELGSARAGSGLDVFRPPRG